MTEVLRHKIAEVPSDPNNKLTIARVPTGELDPSLYRISHADDPGHVELMFQTLESSGLTNEALLAIVHDRLGVFQGGLCKCHENDAAMQYVALALDFLKKRTIRRNAEGTEGTKMEKRAEPQNRVRMDQDGTTLMIGATGFPADALKQWKTWNTIETACKQLDPPLSPLELSVIENAAAHLGGGARNGLTELKSALANSRAARAKG